MRFVPVSILFAVVVAALTLIAKFGYQRSLEAEFSEKVNAALDEGGLSGVVVNFDDYRAILSGVVESREEHEAALMIIAETLPTVYVPSIEASAIAIKPTLPPKIRIERKAGEARVILQGTLSAEGESNRDFLALQLSKLKRVENIKNEIKLDPRQLPFSKMPELASFSVNLMRHPGAALISFEDGRLTISGKVPNAGLRAGIMELAAKLEADSVEGLITTPEVVRKRQTSSFSITRNRFGITVSGILAKEEDRRELLNRIRSWKGTLPIRSRIEIDNNYETGAWEKNAHEIISLILRSLEGEWSAEFNSAQVRLKGLVESTEDLKYVKTALAIIANSPQGPKVSLDLGVKKGVNKSAEVRLFALYEKGTLTFSGNVPSLSFFRQLEEDLEGEKVVLVNKMEETPATEGQAWVDRLAELFCEFDRRLISAEVRIKGDQVRLDGETIEPTGKLIIQNVAFNIFPSEFRIDNQLKEQVKEPALTPKLEPEDLTKLQETLGALPIYFGSNRETIENEGREKIEKISNLIKETRTPLRLKVTGFADKLGHSAYNQQLSLRRAKSVAAFLTDNGAPEDAVIIDFVGEDLSNLSRYERWKARRVEVSIEHPIGGEDKTGGEITPES
jgi:outer membrane protein OmpA-like peptidoglycan-associated protein